MVRCSSHVTLPVLAVHVGRVVFLPQAAVGQQDGHTNDVEVGKEVTTAAGQAVHQASHKVACVC